MGCEVKKGDGWIEVQGKGLKGTTVDISEKATIKEEIPIIEEENYGEEPPGGW